MRPNHSTKADIEKLKNMGHSEGSGAGGDAGGNKDPEGS